MAQAGGKDGKPGKPVGGGRQERLAAALRENLKRRKAQARGREGEAAAGPIPAHSCESGNPESD